MLGNSRGNAQAVMGHWRVTSRAAARAGHRVWALLRTFYFMPNKYNRINEALIRERKWGALLESLLPGGYIFAVPDAVAAGSLQVSVSQFNKGNPKLHISIKVDKVNLGVALTVTRTKQNEH